MKDAGRHSPPGYIVILLIVTATAIVEQQTLMRASADSNATTFEEMCRPIPGWARQTTMWSGLIYLWACGGFYFDFLLSFAEGQLCPILCLSHGDAWLCQNEWHLAIPITIMVVFVCWPSEFSGGLARSINLINIIIKTVVILAVIFKGLMTWKAKTEASTYVQWNFLGFFRTSSILMGSLANSGIMPQLVSDIEPDVRDRATKWCPIISVSLQSLVYFSVGLVGYGALGNLVDVDIFSVYQRTYPGPLTSVLQGSFALMMYLGYPLVIIPCKSQVWSLVASKLMPSEQTLLSSASLQVKAGLTLFFSLPTVLVPLMVGSAAFGQFTLVLASTAGVWMNLLLPAIVLIYCRILPNRAATRSNPHRGRDWASLMTVGWILLLGLLCLLDGFRQLGGIFKSPSLPPLSLSQECRNAFDGHVPHGPKVGMPLVQIQLLSWVAI